MVPPAAVQYGPLVPVILVKGDLLNTPGFHAFAHSVDASGAMATGIAVAFKKRWPAMFEDFQKRAQERKPQMGDTVVWTDGTDTIYSLVVQAAPDKAGTTAALDRAVEGMITAASSAGIEQIAVSRLGAGKAALDWTRVKRVLEERADARPVTLQVYEQFVRSERKA